MHTVIRRSNVFLVGYYIEDWYDERKLGQTFIEVFRTPKESVAWGVCSFFNGSGKTIFESVRDAQFFLESVSAKAFDNDFYI